MQPLCLPFLFPKAKHQVIKYVENKFKTAMKVKKQGFEDFSMEILRKLLTNQLNCSARTNAEDKRKCLT